MERSSKRTVWPLRERSDSPWSCPPSQASGGDGALPSVRPNANSLRWKFSRRESITLARMDTTASAKSRRLAKRRREDERFMESARRGRIRRDDCGIKKRQGETGRVGNTTGVSDPGYNSAPDRARSRDPAVEITSSFRLR